MTPPDEIFISYCWADNTPTNRMDEQGRSLGWVEHFEMALAKRLMFLRGRKTGVWRDASDMRGNFQLNQDVYQALDSAMLLVSHFSRSYVNSDWCPVEFDRFSARMRRDDRDRWARRVFRVFRNVVGTHDLPANLMNGKCYEFFRRSANGVMTETLEPDHKDHETLLNVLATDLVIELEQLHVEDRGTVYLASPAADLQFRYVSLRSALRNAGYKVFPEESYPDDGPAFLQAVKREMLCCEAMIFPVGAEPQIRLGDGSDPVQAEFAAALACCDPVTRPLLLWFPESNGKPGISFVREFLEGKNSKPGAECRRSELPQMKTQCLEWLSAAKERKAAHLMAKGGVYLVYDQIDGDAPLLRDLLDFIAGKGGRLIPRSFDGTPAGLRKAEADALRVADKVIFFSSASSDQWLVAKQGALMANPSEVVRRVGYVFADGGRPAHVELSDAIGPAVLIGPVPSGGFDSWWEGLS